MSRIGGGHLKGLFGTAHRVSQALDVDQVQRPDVVAGAVAPGRAAAQGHRGKQIRGDSDGPLWRGRIGQDAHGGHAPGELVDSRLVTGVDHGGMTEASEA